MTNRMLRWSVLLLLIVAMPAIFSVLLAPSQATQAAPIEQTRQSGDVYAQFAKVYDRVSPSVVAITVSVETRNRVVTGSGSGFVMNTDGHIITNNHVVVDAARIEIEFLDGTLTEAEVVGLDPDSDLAVLHVDVPAETLVPVEFGDSEALIVGQPVLAIGNPFGQNWTLTTGVVSGLGRTIQGLSEFSVGGVIQTDTAINPGNSGGPLLDLEGRVIGVNSQILSRSRVSSGVGFAVPGNLTERVATELIANGAVSYSFIGITGSDLTLDLIENLALPNNTRGVVVNRVAADGPAALGGVSGSANPNQADIITAVNGVPVRGMEALISFLARETTPGDVVTLTVIHDGSDEREVEVLLTTRP